MTPPDDTNPYRDDDASEIPAPDGAPPQGDAARLAAVEAERDALRDKYQRTLAEAENMRKRATREVQDARQYAIAEFARELLAVLDNLQRALDGATSTQKADPLVKGVQMVHEQFLGVLANHGVTIVDAKGQPFDPRCHEAILQDERDDVPPGTVLEELVRGYRLRDRLLRAAVVKVARARSGDSAAGG